MADRDDLESLQQQVSGTVNMASDIDAPLIDVNMLQCVYYVWALWMDYHIFINSPYIPPQYPPKIIKPTVDSDGNAENIYPIFDYGDHFSASIGSQLAEGSRSTGKMLNTIIKIVELVVKRVASVDANAGTDEGGDEGAIRVAMDGHEIAQRMGFKQCVMHERNILVTNFDPGEWGEHQLSVMEHLADRGYLPGVKKG